MSYMYVETQHVIRTHVAHSDGTFFVVTVRYWSSYLIAFELRRKLPVNGARQRAHVHLASVEKHVSTLLINSGHYTAQVRLTYQ